jgi:hypothetical protein
MTFWQKIFVALAACHLGMVTYFGFSLPAPSIEHPAGFSVRWYGAMTGSSNTYGFFKFIGGTCRVSFRLADADGNFWTDVLKRADNPEAEMRYRLTAFQLGDYGETLAKHWAATMFARHPQAVQVIVDFEQYDPPSMADFRAGQRAAWKTTYTQFFWKKDMLQISERGATP